MKLSGLMSSVVPPLAIAFASSACGTGLDTLLKGPATRPVLYVASFTSNQIYLHDVDSSTGVLTLDPVTPQVASANVNLSLLPVPGARFMVLDDNSSSKASVYSIAQSSGVLNPVVGSSLTTGSGSGPNGPGAILPGGGYFYTANYNNKTISAFALDVQTGSITGLGGFPLGLGGTGNAQTILITPSGKFAYLCTKSEGANCGGNCIYAFTVDPASGLLTTVAGSPFIAGLTPVAATTDPREQFYYVANFGANTVSEFTINPSTGQLTSMGAAVGTGVGPTTLTVHPNGNFLYVVNNSGSISVYAINAVSGALTPVAGSPFPTGANPKTLVFDPSGSFAYVTSFGEGVIYAYRIDKVTGALGSTVAGSPFQSNAHAGEMVLVQVPR